MKKQLSLLLITLGILSINLVPVEAASKTTKTDIESSKSESTTIGEGQWCFELPQMGLFCIDL